MSLPPDDQILPAKPKMTPAEIGAALGMTTAEAAKLLTAHRWREGDVEQLEAAAARLGLQVPMPDPWRP